jgi:hypothetical protein
MRMVAAVVRARQLRAGVVIVARRGVGRAMVFSRVVVSEAVSHLREEEAYPKEKGEQDDREARATQVAHRVKITRDRHRGSRRDSSPGKTGYFRAGKRAPICSVSARFRATRTGRVTSNGWSALVLLCTIVCRRMSPGFQPVRQTGAPAVSTRPFALGTYRPLFGGVAAQ